MMVLGS